MWSRSQHRNDPTEDTVFAKLVHPEHGYGHEQENAKQLTIGQTYLVDRISMGQSHTSIWLHDIKSPFSSVQFEFFDHNLKPLDIYSDARYNPYIMELS